VKGPNLKVEYVTGQCLVDQAKEFFGHVHKIGTHRIKMKPDARYHKYVGVSWSAWKQRANLKSRNLNADEFLVMKDISQGASVGFPTKVVVGFTVIDRSKGDIVDCVSYFRSVEGALNVDQNYVLHCYYCCFAFAEN